MPRARRRAPGARATGRASTSMTAQVLAAYGRTCWLRLPGCTVVATTKDHIIPHAQGGQDVLENYRPACRPCNSKRQNKNIGGMGARIIVVTGPPAAGKSTYVREHAGPADIVIDLDVLARALMANPPESTHVYPPHIRHVAIGARSAAINRATRLAERATVWIIHAIPKPEDLAEYRALRWQVLTIDPGRDVVTARAKAQRPPEMLAAVDRWYAQLAMLTAEAAGTPEPTDTPAVPVPAGTAAPSRSW